MLSAAHQTLMFTEAGQAAAVVAHQAAQNAALMRDVGARLRALKPPLLFTCARGSSDHAATFAKYLFETQLRTPTLSQAPSIASLYGGPLLHMADRPFLVISQSGRSPDLLRSAEAARAAGAWVIALVNDVASPLAAAAETVIPLQAGPERSVAATKSYLASLAAFIHLAAAWSDAPTLWAAHDALPAALDAAWQLEWQAALETMADTRNLYVLGRGLTLGPAQEAALKFKETSGVHAEAFSIAEVAHGPMALVGPDFPLLVFPPVHPAAQGLEAVIAKATGQGARVLVAGRDLPLPSGLDPVVAPAAMVQSFYRCINQIAVARGHNPDAPPLLSKVTQTT
jgi:glutamine---fructose-6-phosphate transaminase (isomerizing)